MKMYLNNLKNQPKKIILNSYLLYLTVRKYLKTRRLKHLLLKCYWKILSFLQKYNLLISLKSTQKCFLLKYK